LLRSDPEVLRLDGQTLLELKLIIRVYQFQIEFLNDGGHDEDSLLPGESAANACSETVAEGLPGVALEMHIESRELTGEQCTHWQSLEFPVQHSLRFELISLLRHNIFSIKESEKGSEAHIIAPNNFIPLTFKNVHNDYRSSLDSILPSQHHILYRFDDTLRSRGCDAESFSHDS
jgi:hypothetical protein